jgi:chromosome segregation ATPase
LKCLLQEISRQTRFVVIMHSKHAMEAVSALYGVTMQESGISRG